MLKCAQKLAVVVKRAREELDLTQEQVAERSDTDVRTIINMESGRGNPKLETLYAVLRTLKIDPREIFDDVSECDSPTARQLHALIDECSAEEASALLRIVKTVLSVLRHTGASQIQ